MAALRLLGRKSCYGNLANIKAVPIRINTRCLGCTSIRYNIEKAWKDKADTVIVGGGCVGVSIAYHLAKRGVRDVVLLEKSELTAGSTWHAAGLTTSYTPTINAKKIHWYSINFYQTLEQETGQNVGFHKTGSLRLASTPVFMDDFRSQVGVQRWNEAPAEVVDAGRCVELHPLINPDSILGGLYTPGDGYIDPYSLTQAMAIGARKYGADIVQGTPVTGLSQREDGTWEVETPRGGLHAGRVVTATGFWAREVGRLAGLDTPLVPAHHQYLVTAPIPAVAALKKELPVVRHMEGSYYVRQERQGLIIGPWEKQENVVLCDDWYRNGVPPGFGKELFEADLDRISEHLDIGMEVIPVLKEADIQTVVPGPITYTPDQLPLLGPVRRLRNFWSAVGISLGITHAGGVGKYLADWMLDGEPPFDLMEWDADRYGPWADKDFTYARARESYGMTYNAPHFPREDRPAGRPTSRTSGIYQTLKQHGAEFGFHSGWEVPHWFSRPGDTPGYRPSFRRTNWFLPVGRECEMVTTRVGIMDLSSFGKLEVAGPDAARFIDYICANNVPKVGRCCISHMLTPKGKVYSELTVTQTEENNFLCLTGSGSEFHDERWMEEKAWKGGYDVTLTNRTEERACLGLAGPKSRDILQKLTSDDMSSKAWPFLHSRYLTLGGVKTLAIRISYTGELGWEIYMDKSDQQRVYDVIREAGEEFGVGDFGSFAMASLRMEKGFRSWGHEMSKDENPIEAGLGMFVKHNKEADFIGKEAVKRILAEPLQQKLVYLTVDTTDVDPHGDEAVFSGDKVIGHVTSGCYGYTVKQSVAFAYVPPEYSSAGTELQVELLGELRPARVEAAPPVLIEHVRNRNKK